MSTFTPEQIQEILDLYFENFAHRQYIGARYVPIFGRKDEDSIEWDNTGTYEPLTIVLYQGNSYTSRQFVPVGVEITNQTYWANTGNYNAQIEQYRLELQDYIEEVQEYIEEITSIKDSYIKTVQNFEELLNTTEDYVLVLNNDSLTGDGSSCIFYKVNSNYEYGTHVRNDGTRIAALPNQSEIPFNTCPPLSFPNVMHSYIGKDDLPYGQGHGLFNPTVQNMIDCSSFVCACIQGISYEQSRYTLGQNANNILSQYGMGNAFPINGIYENYKGALPTYWLAEWFAEHKRLFKFGDIHTNNDNTKKIQTGDILFSANGEYEEHLYGINHCMLVIETYPNDGMVLIAEAGGAPGTFYTYEPNENVKLAVIDLENNSGNNQNYEYWARPNYYYTNEFCYNIGERFDSNGVVYAENKQGTNVELGLLRLNQPLKKNKFYTLIVEGTIPAWLTNNMYLMGNSGTSPNQIRAFRTNLNPNKAAIIFDCIEPPNNRNWASRVLITAQISENALDSDYCEITKATVVEGICTDATLCEKFNVTFGEDITGRTIDGYITGTGKVCIIGECTTPSELGSHLLFTIPNMYNYIQYRPEYRFVGFIGDDTIIPIRHRSDGEFYIQMPSGTSERTLRFYIEI